MEKTGEENLTRIENTGNESVSTKEKKGRKLGFNGYVGK